MDLKSFTEAGRIKDLVDYDLRGHISSKHVGVKEIHKDAFDFETDVRKGKGGQQRQRIQEPRGDNSNNKGPVRATGSQWEAIGTNKSA